jgi:hypothetical protein
MSRILFTNARVFTAIDETVDHFGGEPTDTPE